MRVKLDWASLIVGSKLTVFAHCFTLYLRTIFQVQAPGGFYLEGRFNGGFLRYQFGGGGAYIWRGLFSEFYGNQICRCYVNNISSHLIWFNSRLKLHQLISTI